MAEADEFDRVIQSVSDGSYRPSPSAGMETFPVSCALKDMNLGEVASVYLLFQAYAIMLAIITQVSPSLVLDIFVRLIPSLEEEADSLLCS